MRKLLRVDLLIIDDFALQPLDALDTADVYELIVERHRAAATVATSNREPIEWLGLMADPQLAQSAIDRLQSVAHELVLDGESYRQRQKPAVTPSSDKTLDHTPAPRRSSPRRRPTPREPGPMSLAHGWSHRAGARHATGDAPAGRRCDQHASGQLHDGWRHGGGNQHHVGLCTLGLVQVC
jgi:IstB-like ATP binding protein